MWKPPGRSSRSCYQFSLHATALSRHVVVCTARVRSAMLHASETWSLTKPNLQLLQRNYRAKIREICNVRMQEAVTTRSNALLTWLGIEELDLILKERRLCWYGHVEMLQWCSQRQPFAYRLRESLGLGGPRWHGSSWQRGTAGKLSAINLHNRNTWRSGVRSAMRVASQPSGRGPTEVDVAPVPAC